MNSLVNIYQIDALLKENRELKLKVNKYEQFLHDINMYVTCCDNDKVRRLISNADNWSYAHRRGNGELTEAQENANVECAFDRLCKVD